VKAQAPNNFGKAKIVSNKNIFIKKGDIIKVDEGFLIWKKKEIKYGNNISRAKLPKYSFRFYTYKNRFKNYMDWFKNKYYFLLKNPAYLEVNCNIKTIIILKNPQYKNIPYPKNLERSSRIEAIKGRFNSGPRQLISLTRRKTHIPLAIRQVELSRGANPQRGFTPHSNVTSSTSKTR